MPKHTIAHVTHEAVEKLGGIGTVLEGMMTSPVYRKHVGRSILVGPCSASVQVDPAKRLGEEGTVLYSTVDNVDKLGLGNKLRPIEWSFDVALVYGKRTYDIPGDKRSGEADVLLIDVFKTNPDRLQLFKFRLAETFGFDSSRFEEAWEFEEYVRLAEPAFYALTALLDDNELPCIMFSHEFMGMPACLKAILDGEKEFRTIFHAHECATARKLVEDHPGHDTMFYNVLNEAREQGKYASDVFGDLSGYFKHELIRRSHCCDGVIAVGDFTATEMHFLGPQFDHHHIDMVYNGLPAMKVTLAQRKKSRKMLVDYSEKLVGYKPDILMTHVTRPVISKGMWRDVKLCAEMDRRLGEQGKKAILYMLTSAGGQRRAQDVRNMESEYGWPRHHREGYPDLVGPEVDIHNMIEPFNAEHKNVQIVLVNQFGWDADRIGTRLPKKMDIADLRFATDVELGMATYEPFGISPLEPLCSGAVCVISNICGCAGFVDYATDGEETENVLVADYTRLQHRMSLDDLLNMTQQQRDEVENAESARLADELLRRVPQTDKERNALISSGQKLAKKMGWDQVVEHKMLPLLERVANGK